MHDHTRDIVRDLSKLQETIPGCFRSSFDSFLRGRGSGNGQEEGLYEKTTPIELIHFYNNLENLVLSKQSDFGQNSDIKSHF